MLQHADDRQDRIFFPEEDGSVMITCPSCGTEKTIDTATHETQKIQFNRNCRCKCKCGNTFGCKFEFRKVRRKKVKLVGTFRFTGHKTWNDIIIRDLSLRGISFTCLDPIKIQPADTIEVTFRLDDKNKSSVFKTATIMRMKDGVVGARFKMTTEYDKELGFYFMNS